MSYNQQLNLMIEKSGKSIKEIAIECKEKGIEITQSYIGILKNNKDRIPSEEITTAICEVCNTDPDILIIEGGLDKAPKRLRDKIEEMRECFKTLMLRDIAPKDKKPTEEIINQIPYSTILDGVIGTIRNAISAVENSDKDKVENYLKEITDYEIYHDNLQPILKKGDKFRIINIPLNRYMSGDILAYRNEEERLEYKEIISVNKENFILKDNEGFYEIAINSINPIGIIDMESKKER